MTNADGDDARTDDNYEAPKSGLARKLYLIGRDDPDRFEEVLEDAKQGGEADA